MAFVDPGDQFIAFAERSDRSSTASGTSASSWMTATQSSRRGPLRGGAEIFGGNFVPRPVGKPRANRRLRRDLFTKAPEILRGMGLELEKSESAQRELRDKGLA